MPRKSAYRKPKMAKKRVGKKRVAKRQVKQMGQMISYNRGGSNQIRVNKLLVNQTFYTAGIPGINGALSFNVGQLPDLASYTGIFTHFKINSVTLTFKWTDNDVSTTDLTNVPQPTLYIAYNDDSNLSSGVKAETKKGCKAFTFSSERTVFTYTVYPKTQSPVYYSSIASGYKTNPKEWISCAYSATPHYGVVMYCDNIAGGTQMNVNQSWDVSFKGTD